MKWWDYVKDKAAVLLVQVAGLFLLLFFLRAVGNRFTNLLVIAFLWLTVLSIWFLVDYKKEKHRFEVLFGQLRELEKPYLIAEVMESSPHLTHRLYREAIRISNRSVMEQIHKLEEEGKDYKEYIEGWVHEIKLPLTVLKLMCENEQSEIYGEQESEIEQREKHRKMWIQLDRVDKLVEQVLYYARMEHAYQDYLIHEVDLRDVVLTAIAANKMYFIQQEIQISMEMPDEEDAVQVSTDEKWVCFLLNQIFANTVKYSRKDNPVVRIYTKRGNNQTSLMIEDNGMGIAVEDRGRIFEKGFTGKNGRSEKKSTGIGLYLCKGLCDKLGIGITCESEEGNYTRMILTFPDSSYNLKKM